MTTPTLEELAAELEAVKSSTPTLEELTFSVLVPCWNNGADRIANANAMTFLVSPIPVRILAIALSWEYWSIPASDTNFWTVTARKGSNGTSWTSIASRATRNTGADANGGVTARKAWTFDAAAWGNSDLSAGDLLRIDFVPTGNPADLDMPFTVSVQYRPL